MSILSQLNSPFIYLVCGLIVVFVAMLCVVFAVRAYRAGKAIGMDVTKMKRTIIASATFAVLPSVGILLGVIALSGSLGTPWPWLRLSVIGALHYETQVAEAAAEAVGLGGLSASQMTAKAFSTIALLMSVCIMWGMVFSLFSCRRYTDRLNHPAPARKSGKGSSLSSFGDKAMTAMFIGLGVSGQLRGHPGIRQWGLHLQWQFPAPGCGPGWRGCHGVLHLGTQQVERRLGGQLLHRGKHAHRHDRGHLPGKTRVRRRQR